MLGRLHVQPTRFRAALAALMIVMALTGACTTQAPAPTLPPSSATPVLATPESPAATTLPPAPQSPPSTAGLLDTAWDDRAVFRQGLVAEARPSLEALDGASVYHLAFEIAGDYSALTGHEAVRYTNREDVPLDAVYFRLFPNIAGGEATVAGVTVDGRAAQPAYEASDSSVRVPLTAALQPGDQVIIELDFAVTLPREMGGNFGLFGYFDNVLVLDTFYPVIPVYDARGWYRETPPPNGDIPYFDAGFYLVEVTAPAALTLVTSGREVTRKQEGDLQTVGFAAGPARDFYLAASTEFEVVTGSMGETAINSYALQGMADSARNALRAAEQSLKSFNARFGAYPYTELDIASTPMQALGCEYPGLMAIALMLYDPEAVVTGTPAPVLLESVVAHEAAHQWFYNVVGNDQANEPWLDEATAQYVTWLYYLDTYNRSAADEYRASWLFRWQRVDNAEIPIGLPSGEYEARAYGAIVYGRGPLFMEALAKEMGQDRFDAFLREYYTANAWDIATGAEFRELAEKQCACDLGPLFDEWVYAAGTP